MASLQILIPETWSASSPAEGLRWLRRDGASLTHGEKLPHPADAESEVVAVVPASRVLIHRVNLPAAGGARLAEVAGFAVEDRLGADPESVHAAVGPRDPAGSADIAVIDKAWLGSLLAGLAMLGVRPRRMVGETALAPMTSAVWDVVCSATGGFVRTRGEQGFALDMASPAAPLALQLALSEARGEGAAPERIVIHMTPDAPPPDLGAWQQALGMAVEAGEAWDWTQCELLPGRGINLLQGDFAPTASARQWLQRYRVPARLAASIAALYVLLHVGDWLMLNVEKRRLDSEMTALFKSAFPDAATIVDAPLQMRRNLSDLRQAHGETQPADFLPLLAHASALPATLGAQLQSLQYERGQLQIDLRLASPATKEALQSQISAAGSAARVESISLGPAGTTARVSLGGTGA